MELIELKKSNNFEEFINYYRENGAIKLFEEILPYINLEKYFKIDYTGRVVFRKVNHTLILLELLINKKENEVIILKKIFEEYIWVDAKEKIKKVERLSNESIEKIKENYFKTLVKQERHFALKYGKELLLRDKKSFYRITLFYSLISGFEKAIFAKAMINIIENFGAKENYFSPFYTGVSFISTYDNNIGNYIKEKMIKSGEFISNEKDIDIVREKYLQVLEYYIDNFEKENSDDIRNAIEENIKKYQDNRLVEIIKKY